MRQLMAASTLLGVANAAAACRTDRDRSPPPPPQDAGDEPVLAATPDAVAADAVAESSLDAATFADVHDADAAKSRREAGAKREINHGYMVVDPIPSPVRIDGGVLPRDCALPYYFDAEGVKHYKPACLK